MNKNYFNMFWKNNLKNGRNTVLVRWASRCRQPSKAKVANFTKDVWRVT